MRFKLKGGNNLTVKIRLHGESEEIEKVLKIIKDSEPFIEILSVSGEYKDRGTSKYSRKYLDVKCK